jgi:DmsE family decaheme c-type cytochrome
VSAGWCAPRNAFRARRAADRGALIAALAAVCLGGALSRDLAADAAPGSEAAKPLAACGECHAREVAAVAGTVHRGANVAAGAHAESLPMPQVCETCHGPIAAHGAGSNENAPIAWAKKTPQEKSAACLTCHGGAMTQHWAGSVHDMRDVGCTDCHRMHPTGTPKAGLPAKADEVETCVGCHVTRKKDVWRASRHPVREGRMVCSGCHDPHGTLADAQLIRPTVNETCLTCHAEKRGPFLWTHPPVAENCLTCHVAHGSLQDSMLVMKPPRLCQSCHNEPEHASLPRNSLHQTFYAPDRFTFNKGCDNCHQVHGSNSPSGATLLR